MSTNEDPNLPVEESLSLPSVSISLQRILRDDIPSNSELVQLNARNNNTISVNDNESQSGLSQTSIVPSSTSYNINENETNGSTRSSPSPRGQQNDPDRGTTSMNPRSKRPRPPKTTNTKPKPIAASSLILEAKKNAQAKAQEQRNIGNSNNINANIEILLPEPEIIIMKDHLQPARDVKEMPRRPTGVVFDLKMLEHKCLWDSNYPENPERLSAILERCQKLGLIDRCVPLLPRYATETEVLSVHTNEHIQKLKDVCKTNDVSKMEEFCSNYDAVFVHPTTYELALLSVGCTVDLVEAVIDGKVQNGMALIRPPGHHAMKSEYCGYCLFNNVAIAAKRALDSGKASRVLIVDFDVHHGQATQQMFYDDKRVLYFSTHRYEHGNFWPNLEESDYNFIGSSEGLGFNCNVPLNKTGLGNADFLTIWHQLLLPMAHEFSPDLVIVSAGYDCVYGCFEGEMELTPQCVPHLLWPLLGLAFGKVAVILEGGYCLKSLAEGAALTLRALLGDPCPNIPKIENPSSVVAETILNSKYMLRSYWHLLKTQQLTNSDIESNIKKRGQLHIPEIKYEWTTPKQDVFLTRDCYPTQNEELQRTISERLDSLSLTTNLDNAKYKVGIVYDDIMLKHRNLQEPGHPETPERISNIFANHADYGLLERCHRLKSREVKEDELILVHSQEHIELMKRTQSLKRPELEKLQNKFNSIFLNGYSYEAALVSAGSVLEVVDNVLNKNCQSGVAIVRPPGHHAEEGYPCGFCIFNNVALAAKYAIENHGLKRILIVDWDVHHGNGIQRMFESDPRVLYISIHRYEHGFFFPCSPDANYNVVGHGQGTGYNVNIPWNNSKMGDTEYLAVFTNIILPIAYEFNPELVLVSAGFDAAKGDPLGGCNVTPEGYGHMTHLLSSLANGKIILALEGGYNLTSIAYSMVLCTKALLGDPLPPLTLNKKIHPGALQSIQNVLDTQSKYWSVLKPFRQFLPHSKRLVSRGHYQSLEDRMADLKIQNIQNNSSAGITNELNVPHSSSALSETSSISPNNSSFELSPVKTQSPEAISISVVFGGEEEGKLGACGGINYSDNKSKSPAHRVVMSNANYGNPGAEPAAVYPLTWCPHLEQIGKVTNNGKIDTSAKCEGCGNEGENWICLICYKTFCGRYVNEHMVQHSSESGHQLALSFADLSIWCYGCESYVRNVKLFEAFSAAHCDKFNEAPPAW